MKPILALPLIHFAASRYGWTSLRSAAFDAKYHDGQWGGGTESPAFIDRLNTRLEGRAVTVLGCGSNGIGRAAKGTWRTYCGVDLSEEALARASHGAPANSTFVRGDMETHIVSVDCESIVFPESLYYVPEARVLPLLTRLASKLPEHGEILATFAEPQRYRNHLSVIRDNFRVMADEPVERGKQRHLIIFR